MQWYLLKTWVGREEELAEEIRRTIPRDLYKECFVIYQERIWRKQQKSIVHVEPLFPGCVFLTCASKDGQCAEAAAEGIYRNRKLVSEIRKFAENRGLGNLGILSLFPVMSEDAQFLEKISGQEHLVKLSYVQKDEEGKICKLSAPLKICQGQIERIQWKKRYAMVRHRLWGEEKVLVLGILLHEDTGSKLFYQGENKSNLLLVNSTASKVLTKEMA